MDLSSGTILSSKYKLIRQLGEGGMGCVWVAEHLHLDRHVAIKFIGNRVISEPSARERFEIEARATARVESPHVVQVLDFDYSEAGLPFLVLELLVGETLEQRISREGPLKLGEARELLRQTTHALSEAHRADIFHRDIKAENLFLVARDDFFVKLLDFGIALPRERASAPDHAGNPAESSPIGTPLYMSPEQTMMLGPIDERSDLFSLGVSMYYALTGDFPFNADTLAVLAFAQQREDFKLPSVHRPDLGPSLDAFFLRALAFHPEDRFQTAEKMLEAFERACERAEAHESIRPRSAQPKAVSPSGTVTVASGRSRKSTRRSRKGPALVVALVAAAAGYFVAPRYLQTAAGQSFSHAAAWMASRIPSAQVEASQSGDSPSFAPARAATDTASAMAPLPLPAMPVAVAAPTTQPSSITTTSAATVVAKTSTTAKTPKKDEPKVEEKAKLEYPPPAATEPWPSPEPAASAAPSATPSSSSAMQPSPPDAPATTAPTSEPPSSPSSAAPPSESTAPSSAAPQKVATDL